MSQSSAIEWTDATWNPVRGCIKVSPGCAHCYAETFAERFRGVPGHPYEQGFDLRLVPEKLEEPFTWKQPRRVFVDSMSDLFQDDVPDTFIMNVFTIMEQCPQHTFQVLTKRAERMRQVVDWLARKWADVGDRFPLPNVWLGVSVENRQWKARVIPHLVSTPAAVRFVSVEPLLEDLGDISDWFPREREVSQTASVWVDGVRWVIVGGESGHGARPFDLAWPRSIVSQCKAAGVPVFVKQLGAHAIESRWPQQERAFGNFGRVQDLKLRSRKGGDPAEWPEDLRVREFPDVRSTPVRG